MPLDASGLCHQRSAAKGCITKVSTQVSKLQALHHSDLDEDVISKQVTAVKKADSNFFTAHQLLQDLGTETPESMAAALDEHELAMDNINKQLKHLSQLLDASELVVAMEESILIMEQSADKPYYPGRAIELTRTDKAVDDFRDARHKPGARRNTSLIDVRDNAVERLRMLHLTYDESKPLPLSPSLPEVPSTVSEIKPPKLEFPVFNGLVEHYLDWRSLFNALLKKTSKISEEEKKVHLARAMGTPEAHSLASHAINSSITYAAALKRLDEKYLKKRLIFSTHLANMLQGGTVSYRSDDLRQLYDRIDINLRGLRRTADFTAEQVTAVLLEKSFDPSVLPHWKKHSKDAAVAPTIQMMLDFLKEHAEYAEESEEGVYTVPFANTTPTLSLPSSSLFPKQAPRQAAPRIKKEASDKCAYCTANHVLFSCPGFKQLSATQRREWVKRVGACFNCLSTGHRVLDCRSKFRCRECQDAHHTLLHDSTVRFSDTSPSTTFRELQHTSTANVMISPSNNPSDYSIPRTAIVTVQATGLILRARAQLDSGASASVISSSLATSLKAPTVSAVRTHLGGISGLCESHRQVLVTLSGNDGQRFEVQCHVLPVIPPTGSNVHMDTIRQLHFLQDLPLADPHYQSGDRIDLLLEMGVVNELFSDHLRYHPARALTAEHTVFGWTVGG